ncbi:alpha/beta fold hydrolase [Hymenobacter jejuensis]|uniref:Alpha/beta fold hydrolase n=1 Tax=Hymenobacter jejuensis TaxID=2502781 RepID=A0A5B8A0S4_9BACT|nr:alpha/beta fold hydrolase [Hymenobacter jejuensis]QDA60303.1 alpha/beta fold hydrolase [Hymenobacter jejuensis]
MPATPVVLPVLELGQGPVSLVFLHYWAGSGLEWQPVMELLAPAYHCLAPDLRGFGAAPAPETGYAVADYAADVAALIAERHLTNYVLVGHSMGGKFAMYLATQQPSGLRGLVLVTPSPPTPEPMTDEGRLANLRAYGIDVAAASTFDHITARPLSPATRQQVIADNLRTSRRAWDEWMLHGSRENISALMSLVQVPAIILTGDSDPVLSPSVQGLETLPYLAPNTHLEIIPGAGHLLPLEAPAEVAELIRSFITKV